MKARWITGLLLALGALTLFPAIAYAHHCDTAQHCFEAEQPVFALAVTLAIAFGAVASAIVDIAFAIIPGVGLIRAEVEGEDLTTWEKVMGVFPSVGKVPRVFKPGSRYVDEAIDLWNITLDGLDAANTVRDITEAVTDNVTSFVDAVTGPGNYPVRRGGEQLQVDGIREDNWYLQDAKYGGSTENNPFKDDSGSPSSVLDKIRQQAEDEIYKYSRVIKDPDSPYQGLEIITNDERVKRFYEDLFLKHDVPGRVRVEEQ